MRSSVASILCAGLLFGWDASTAAHAQQSPTAAAETPAPQDEGNLDGDAALLTGAEKEESIPPTQAPTGEGPVVPKDAEDGGVEG